tara:strand:- start:27122 stop:28414 length:1293 start_codon:yes stop_codon:yes gene_type:complete
MSNKKSNTSTIAIVGMGYVGIPLCKSFLESGNSVIGIDINETRIRELNNNHISLNHLADINFEEHIDNNMASFSSDFKVCAEADSIIICVPTPVDKDANPDLGPIKNAISSIIPYLKEGHLISLESTTYPGTTKEEIVLPLEENGYKVGKDIYVVYSPEREDPGNKDFNCKNTPKLVGGHSNECLKKGIQLYSKVVDQTVPVSSCEIAEFAKLYENTYRAVNIGLANEMKVVADSFNLDIYEIIRAAATKPFGFSAFYPGPGVGGHCIPVDPAYLNWKAEQNGIKSNLIEHALKINKDISKFVVNKAISELKDNGKGIKDSNILVLGVSYKNNIDDIRESPSIDIIKMLLEHNAKVSFDDDYVSYESVGINNIDKINNITSDISKLKKFDAVLLLTSHDYYNIENVSKHCHIVVDTRGIFNVNDNNIIRG